MPKTKAYVEGGGKLGWWIFRPQIVRECLYILKQARVNGRECVDLAHIQPLVDFLYVNNAFCNTWKFWESQCEKSSGPFSAQLQLLRNYGDALELAFIPEEEIKRCRNNLALCNVLVDLTWNDHPLVYKIYLSCRLALARIAKQTASERIQKIQAPFMAISARGNAHPVVFKLSDAVQNRQIIAFECAYNENQELFMWEQVLYRVNKYLYDLSQLTPEFATQFEQTCINTRWDQRVGQIRDVWHWAQAKTWLEDYILKDDTQVLDTRSVQIEREVRDNITKLASLHAWSFCCSRLRRSQKEHGRMARFHKKAW